MTTTKAAKTRADTSHARTAYLVLGMHRSGTSAVTQLLALAGAHLPENVMPGDEHNEKGYFEPWKIAIFNDERLRAAGAAWDDVFAYPYRALGRRDERVWLNRAAELFQSEYGEARYPLLKDPRVSVLLPFWRTVLADLEIGARCVIPVRHPLAVAGSLAKRNGFPAEKAVLLWAAYMLAAEADTRDLPRVFVGYDALLSDWRAEVARMETAHGAPLPKLTKVAGDAIDKFLSPDLRHNSADGGLERLGWAGAIAAKVLAWCEAAARDEDPDRAALAEATEALAQRREEIGPLVSPAARDLDRLRAEVLELHRKLEVEDAQHAQALKELREAMDRERKHLQGAMRRERKDLEAGWQRDVATWEANVRGLETEVVELKTKLAALRRDWDEVGERLDRALADG